jgi:hypothetical protein
MMSRVARVVHAAEAAAMRIKVTSKRCLVGIAMLIGVVGTSNAQRPAINPDSPLDAWMQSLEQRFAPCVGPLGSRVDMPTTSMPLNDADVIARIELARPGVVSDGYRSTLLVHGPTRPGYIVQIGGFAGTKTVYGPLSLATGCAGLHSRGSSRFDANAIR